jgi:hypothetical protein
LDEFPAIRTGNILFQTGKGIAPNSELRMTACGAKQTSQRPKCVSANDPERAFCPTLVCKRRLPSSRHQGI